MFTMNYLTLDQYRKLTLREQIHRDTLHLSEDTWITGLCNWGWCYAKLARESFRNTCV